MGYDFRITRKSSWSDADGKVIQVDEWLTLAGSIAELEPISEVSVPSDWHTHLWQGHPEYRPFFELRSGDIVFRGTDPATLGFALKLARALDARIVGEEGEPYPADEIVGSIGTSNPVNPFTSKPIFQERRGVVEFRDGESHLISSRRTLFGLRKAEGRPDQKETRA